jgi:hypothetical protein
VKVAVMCDTTHNPFDEARWVSCLRENLTSSSYGEGLETGRAVTQVPRQSLTRQLDLRNLKTTLGMEMLSCKSNYSLDSHGALPNHDFLATQSRQNLYG